jgi:hypothetical protein
MVPVLGLDAGRIRQMIRVGTVANGEYRYRWEGVDVAADEVESLLSAFPKAEPSRVFDPQKCFLARFRRGPESLDLPRDAASRKPLFGKRSFWEGLVDLAAQGVHYQDYSYADKADRFTLEIDSTRWEQLRALFALLKPKSAADRLERLHPEAVDWLVRR